MDASYDQQVANKRLRSSADLTTQMRALRRLVAVAAGKVNGRNSATPEAPESNLDAIQQSLDDAARMLPSEWWSSEAHSEAAGDLQSSHEHLVTQIWFYQVQAFLHLPLMLKAASGTGTDTNVARSRPVCLDVSRKLLRVYDALRQPHLAPCTSKCGL